ncbi:MAG: hypothetical protein AAGC63_11615 [Propionicimonas sp.]|nr:hypothetical protein [Propionicimonas sp.]
MPLTWTITDRANRIWFYLFLVVAVAAGAGVVWGEPQVWAIALSVALLFQAWRLANERTVVVTVDEHGVSKQLGRDSWRREWSQAERVELRRVWGTHQLVLTGAGSTPQEWSFSNKLLGLARIGRGSLAVQVAPGEVPAVRDLLARRGLSAS